MRTRMMALALLACAPMVQAAGICRNIAPGPLETLDKSYKLGHFKVYYTLTGDDAIDPTDQNKNGQPDVVDDLISQLRTAEVFYSAQLGLKAPLNTDRYASAKEISIWLYDLKAGNGIAYDEVVKTNKPTANKVQMDCSLRIDLDSKRDYSRNVSPAHELFHLYQYGQIMFKTRWYLEGMARWVETAFSGSRTGLYQQEAPASLFARVYNAAPFWQAEGIRIEAGKQAKYGLPKLQYLNGESPLNPETFKGGKSLSLMFSSLATLTDQISAARKLDPHNWPEKLQKSNEFDEQILQRIQSIPAQSKEN